ncbi:MAG: ABC transporter ATP-binding protein [Proteobacteria bacterium]|nr:ABC transporter ATP-binding protein [Pseudomonadota bacterium]
MTPEKLLASTLFECRGVHYSYQGRFPALNGIDLTITEGERVALVGANGSGKSTFLHLLDALIFPDRGTLIFSGEELTEASFLDAEFSLRFRRKIGLVFQNPEVQLFCPTVREDIAFGPLQLGIPEGKVKERLESLAQTLRIDHLLDRSPHQLSVGEKRKVAFATTMAIEPEVLLLDEPTAGLDPKTSTQLIEMLIQASHSGRTIVTATHDLHIIEDIADKVYVFGQDKRLAGSGTPAEILGNTALLQANNLIHIHPHHDRDHKVMKA